jgi:polyhydroxyalkanoate synthesis regulator phasin
MGVCDLDELTAAFSARYFATIPTLPIEVDTDTTKVRAQLDHPEFVDDGERDAFGPEHRQDLPIPLIRASPETSSEMSCRGTGAARMTRAIIETLMHDGEVVVSQECAERRRVYEILNVLEWLGLVQKEKLKRRAGQAGKAYPGRPRCVYRFTGSTHAPNSEIRHLTADIDRLRKEVAKMDSELARANTYPASLF